MSKIAYITPDGSLVHIYGLLWSGIYDMGGVPIFEKDRVSIYIPTLDEHREGTVVFRTEDEHPQWLVRLDKPYKHEHPLAPIHGLPSYETQYHYLDGEETRVLEPLHRCLEEVRIGNMEKRERLEKEIARQKEEDK